MARYNGSVCRLCRREGMKLFLKGDRCFTEKCAIEKRNYAPGMHGKGGRIKSKIQGYGLQLREKQKVKRLYGMLEGQFALTFRRASQEKGVVGEVPNANQMTGREENAGVGRYIIDKLDHVVLFGTLRINRAKDADQSTCDRVFRKRHDGGNGCRCTVGRMGV